MTTGIAIIKDRDGYELCLVSSETFDRAVANPPWVGPAELGPGADVVGSWAWRREAIDAKAKKKDKGKKVGTKKYNLSAIIPPEVMAGEKYDFKVDVRAQILSRLDTGVDFLAFLYAISVVWLSR